MDVIRLLERDGVKVYKNVKETGRQLGVGSYGTVVELTIRGEGKFAAKRLHEVLIADGDTSHLVKECKLMSELRHPNITKFFGVCKLSSSTVPALVMELMDHSLEEVIENADDFPLETAISVFIDIANGLAYLHSRNPQVLHRDLTARNVLLDKLYKAKITDFGNSRIVDATKVSKTMTQAPGATVYMPPEALDSHSKYGDRLDTFSFGHLALYATIREFPKDLLRATYYASDGRFVARTEVERRSSYMEKLHSKLSSPDHHLYRLVQQCLHNDPTKRPSSTELLHWLQEIQQLEQGEVDVEDPYQDLSEGMTLYDDLAALYDDLQASAPNPIRSSRSDMLQKFETEINTRSEENEEDLIQQQNKTGLIEKRSGGLNGGWRAYSFTIDHVKGTFQYRRTGPFSRSPKIELNAITRIEELDSDGTRFPFEIHFVGKGSPWELNVYSEADRREWSMALLPEKSQEALPKPHKEAEGIHIYEEIPDIVSPSSSRAPHVQEELYEMPVLSDPATNVSSDSTDKEELYEKMIDYLKEKFNPSQMDAVAIMLQSMKDSINEDTTKTSGPPPDFPPPPPPPPDAYETVEIYPDIADDDGIEDEGIYEPHKAMSKPKPVKKKPPVAQKPKKVREFYPSKNPEDLQEFRRLVNDKAVMADETLLITEAAEALKKDRPTWSLARQATPALTPLEILHKEALSISESSLSGITQIGEGKFGKVYKAQMQKNTVAVKVTKKYSSEKAMRDFQNEMSIMSEVAHHNIVRLYGIISEGRLSPALVMEYLPHGNLQTFLRMKKQPNMSLLKYMTDVAMGMHYLSEKGLIHRDLAARNVLVDKNETCKVSDFGLLREVPKDNNIYVSTYQGPSPLRWMPPESINNRIFSPASDVWSYGILQWEMFNPEKEMPYHNLNDVQMVIRVSEGYRMPTPRGCPGLAAKIMRACWQHEPSNRPSFLLISNLLTQRLLA